MNYILDVLSQNSYPTPKSPRFSTVLSPRSFVVLHFLLGIFIYLYLCVCVCVCVCVKVVNSLIRFICYCSKYFFYNYHICIFNVLAPFLEFSPLDYLSVSLSSLPILFYWICVYSFANTMLPGLLLEEVMEKTWPLVDQKLNPGNQWLLPCVL